MAITNTKTCPDCQTENDASAKFCCHCGSELPWQSSQNSCQSCGFENPEDAKFCAACGDNLSSPPAIHHSSTPKTPAKQKKKRRPETAALPNNKYRKRQQTQPKRNYLLIGVIAAGLGLLALYYLNHSQPAERLSDSYLEQKTTNLELESKVFTVASKFVCACDSCPEEPLETCSCPTARKERDYIRNALYNQQPVDGIILLLNENYGGLKEEYQSQYGAEKVKLRLPSYAFDSDLAGNGTNQLALNTQIASFANRQEIISHFTCPCGQCELDELKDCNCDHLRGAKEIKQFIDQQIEAGTYPVVQIIELVEKQYGGRIR